MKSAIIAAVLFWSVVPFIAPVLQINETVSPDVASAIVGIGILAWLPLYFLPTIVASGHRYTGAIFILNLLLGWTLIGWVGALVWAAAATATATRRFAS